MALKVRAKVSLKDLRKVEAKIAKEFVDDKLVNDFQRTIVRGIILPMIAKGISPVKGFGRFVGYKDPESYPGKGKSRQKPSRPVNLFLTGELMSWFYTVKASGSSLNVGIPANATKFVKIKAEANNLGTDVIPRRRFIPQEGETWAVSVMREVKNLFTKRMKDLLS